MLRKIIKKIPLIILVSALFLLNFAQLAQVKEPVEIYFFRGEGCPHCAKEEDFLDKLKEGYGDQLIIYDYEVWYNKENSDLLDKFIEAYPKQKVSGVPTTFVGEEVFIGFNTEATTGKTIEKKVENCLENECPSPTDIVEGRVEPSQKKEISKVVSLPFIGEVDLGKYSLPVLTLVIAGLDGFNPCAMWVLIFLIGLLLGMKNRRKMWALGITFIAASALTYFIFLAAWLNIFLFIGYLVWTRLIIGLLAIGVGAYYLREYWKNRQGVCKVTQSPFRKRILNRLREISLSRKFWIAFGSIIALAFVVNLIELACSAGFPAIYTQVLALNELANWQYYAYLAFYILIFMLDDIIVFTVAMITLKAVGLSAKYSRYSNIIGGLVIFILGILMIFRPSLLMFG